MADNGPCPLMPGGGGAANHLFQSSPLPQVSQPSQTALNSSSNAPGVLSKPLAPTVPGAALPAPCLGCSCPNWASNCFIKHQNSKGYCYFLFKLWHSELPFIWIFSFWFLGYHQMLFQKSQTCFYVIICHRWPAITSVSSFDRNAFSFFCLPLYLTPSSKNIFLLWECIFLNSEFYVRLTFKIPFRFLFSGGILQRHK